MIVNRRTFLKKSSASTCACLAIGGAVSSCATARFVPYQLSENRIAVKKSDFEDDDYVLVKVEQLAEAIFIYKKDNSYSAVLTRCTHKACEVRPAGTTLRCPCHGSEFDFEGIVLEGPAEDNLNKFDVETDDEIIYVS
ncbi:MAG: Rieske (2Fe-2S) protein [Cyclobacteriaceae bacterium]